MTQSDELVPVIVGVGQINDRPPTPEEGLDSAGLMETALRAADADGGGGWLADLDSLALVDQISFRALGDVSQALADRIGARPSRLGKTRHPNGDSPIRLLNEAANLIGSGEIRIAAVVGGEALRTAAQRAAKSGGETNVVRAVSTPRAPTFRSRYGLLAPVDVYPLYENATRAAWGQSLKEAQAESGEIWSRFSRVAEANPGAWIRRAVSAEEIETVSGDNRRIAYPYTKLMVANSSVNQGAGFLVASLAEARRRGVPEDRLIFVGRGAAAHECDDFLARDRYDRSPSMAVSIRRALELNALEVGALDFVELYSCFPCVPKMARRILNWPVERPASVFGGLTFGGGPIGNYMSHAVVSMTEALRRQGETGLLFANGGFATHNHTLLLSRRRRAGVSFPQDFDFQHEADAARGRAPALLETYSGDAEIETYTVLYQRDGSPRWGVVVARTPSGARTLAKVRPEDELGIAFLSDGLQEPVGRRGRITTDDDGDQLWALT